PVNAYYRRVGAASWSLGIPNQALLPSDPSGPNLPTSQGRHAPFRGANAAPPPNPARGTRRLRCRQTEPSSAPQELYGARGDIARASARQPANVPRSKA